ncbi:RNA methyltransferase [Granulosicoccus antarcticus]|uniref:tRNA (cytidine/uridine-2'-O-)-methyltransferase TrmJ n=1 Tax=Granulosicoccus antarcticus IMCC3135 TaxID=1192854 RepID=A0A2Z2NXJ1_9GAMM|nr:RNA methyltransferase [Granulosicoccus antarcticus]ASJ75185.1 tRNA (cytidine/uridine-2'-O-)-methyltransferase TrmJ [Granulosicoccus antarcticus IMCC3135]
MSVEIVFVMVGTTHTGNLGAAARAMKTMGFMKMRLVDTCPHLSAESLARSSGANDVLKEAQTFDSLQEAIADCRIVVGTSARARQLAVPLLSCRKIAEGLGELAAQPDGYKVAIVFGQERSGLSNESLDLCTRLLRIPCNPDFSSLNLGSAVQVVSYELSQALQSVPQGAPMPQPGKWKGSEEEPGAASPVAVDPDELPATSESMEHFFEHLDRVMVNTGFLDPENPRLLRRRVRRYFETNRPSGSEVAIFRGILSSVENPRKRG